MVETGCVQAMWLSCIQLVQSHHVRPLEGCILHAGETRMVVFYIKVFEMRAPELLSQEIPVVAVQVELESKFCETRIPLHSFKG